MRITRYSIVCAMVVGLGADVAHLSGQTGACCNIDTGGCSLETEVDCGFIYQGDGSECDPNGGCKGACCDPLDNDNCSLETEALCEAPPVPFIYQGDGTVCGPLGECPEGACCFDVGNCGKTTPDACVNIGTYRGDGTSCQPDPPCPFVGACCRDGEACVEIVESACVELNGDWRGENVPCDMDTCPGACCENDGSCTVVFEAACTGDFRGGDTTCPPSPACPQPGACCLTNGDCSMSLQLGGGDCTAAGGVYQGNDTDCGSVSCPQPGACCIEGICTVFADETLDGSFCTDTAFGDYQGVDTDCASVECPGSCCFDSGLCLPGVTESSCSSFGGFFARTSTECLPTGACCLEDGTCTVFSEACCREADGLFQGIDTVCSMVLGACCFGSGACEELDETCCAAAEGTFRGGGSTCAPEGACCMADGSCLETREDCCTDAGGAFQGQLTLCTPTGACCLGDGTCQELNENCCVAAGGTFDANGSCGPAEACCLPDGSCAVLSELCCIQAGGSLQGLGFGCGVTGACCVPAAVSDTCDPVPPQECSVTTVCECLNNGGTFLGANSECEHDVTVPIHSATQWTHVIEAVSNCPSLGGAGPPCQPSFTKYDPWQTVGDGSSCEDFSSDDACPIPANFFGPGSDFFDGLLCFRGDPLGVQTLLPLPALDYGNADTVVIREADPFDRCGLPGPGTVEVAIQMRALSLTSCEPLSVTFNGGQDAEVWDVSLSVDFTQQLGGTLTATKTHCNGGTFDSVLNVCPSFVFTKVDPPNQGMMVTLDFCACNPVGIVMEANGVAWVHDPGSNVSLLNPVCTDFFPGVSVAAEKTDCDCNANGIRDKCDIENNTSQDCNGNGIPDDCEVPPIGGDPDCNTDGIPDECQLENNDCNHNGVPDECEQCGSLDGDQDVDDEDFAIFTGAFGSCVGDANFEPLADFDNDGCITFVDYQAWLGHFQDFIGDPFAPPPIPADVGDMNADGAVNGGDLQGFVNVLLDPANAGFRDGFVADVNGDGSPDEADITGFVGLLLGQES